MKKVLVFLLAIILCVGFTGCSKEKTNENMSSTSSAASGPSVFEGNGGKNSSSQGTATSQSSSSDNSSKTDSSSKNSSSSSKVESSSSSSKVSSTKKPSSSSASVSSQYKDPIPSNAPRIICWGDSITAGMGMAEGCDYPAVLQGLVGNGYRVQNAGASGEKSQTIAARQGAYEVFIDRDLVFEKDYGSVYLDGVNGPNFILADGTVLDINEDGEAFRNDLPCKKVYIDGKEFELNAAGKKIEILREDYHKKLVIKKGAKVVFESAKAQQGSYCEIFYVGANDGVPSLDALVERYKAMAKRQGSDRYIVIIPQWDSRYTEALKAEFGDKALDIRAQMSSIDPSTFGFFASSSDRAEMAEGKIPTLYKYKNNPSDSLHLNEYGYTAMANIIYEHGKKLGYWK